MTFLSALLPYARPPDSAVSGRRFVDSIFAGVGRFVNYIFPMGWRFVTLIVRGKGWRFVNLIFGRVDLLIRFSKGSGDLLIHFPRGGDLLILFFPRGRRSINLIVRGKGRRFVILIFREGRFVNSRSAFSTYGPPR